MIQFSSDKIKEIYVGSDKIKEVYHGSDLVWSGKKPSYAILTDGTRVDFEEENTPIENFCNNYDATLSRGVQINNINYRKDAIKELFFGTSYASTISFPRPFLRNFTSLQKLDVNAMTDVIALASNSFHSTESITNIDLSTWVNLTSIGENAFTSTGAASIIIGAIIPPQLHALAMGIMTNIKHIYVPCESVQAYKTANRWKDFANIISCIATKAPSILFKANEVNVGFKYFRGDGGYNITNAGIELSIANGTYSVVGTNLAYDVSEYSGIRIKYIQENSTNIETKVAIGLTNSSTTNDNRMYRQFINGSPGTYEREAIFEFTTVEGVVDKYGASIYIQYQEGFADEKPNAKITITEIEMI